MMLYDVYYRDGSFDADVALTDAYLARLDGGVEYARNVNWDRHVFSRKELLAMAEDARACIARKRRA